MTTELPDGFTVGLGAGSRIAGYRLEERIGQGGMAVVFRAHDERLDRPVALKILAPTLAGDGEFQRRFIRESRAAATIDDPYIVPVFAAGAAGGMLYIAMRYVAGGDARSLLNRDGPLPPDRVAAIISSVASALDAAHRAGLVHRDVKPSNMLMDVLPGRPDHVYLSDFGLSKTVASTSGVTAAGAVLGTLSYMSPEQIGAKPVDGRADQYALACSAFELLAGAPPFMGDEPAAVMFAHLSGSPPLLTSRRPGLPPAVDQVLSRGLAKVPGDRYASCGQFADALRDAFGLPPYRSDPRFSLAQTHPPTEIVWPEARSAVGTPGASAAATTIYVPPGADSGATRQRPRPRRRIVIAALIIVTAAAGLTAALLPGGPAPAAAPAMTVPISLKSAQAEGSYVYVVYNGGNQANADIYGDVRKAASGEIARLYGQQFPYRKAPARVASAILRPEGGTARYGFQVSPTLATRYRVELFRNSTSSTPFAISATETIYVSLGYGQGGDGSGDCSRPVCYQTVQQTVYAPPSVLRTEMAKSVYLYFGLNLAPSRTPPLPKWMSLWAGSGIVLAVHRVSANEFSETASFSFGIGHEDYNWTWTSCTKDSEAADGLGLPGHHGCGDQRILYSSVYQG